ncbi:hypothetical protein ACFFX0_31350 [Citricoccus parietis]|uniref:Uncharacterized protein n=1 Tax=Citricoccus parietis TaxID=592307 RepID=A0ABV5GAC8_9MICC
MHIGGVQQQRDPAARDPQLDRAGAVTGPQALHFGDAGGIGIEAFGQADGCRPAHDRPLDHRAQEHPGQDAEVVYRAQGRHFCFIAAPRCTRHAPNLSHRSCPDKTSL